MDEKDPPFTLHGEMPGADPKDIPADAADKTVAAVLGEIVWLMSQSKEHRHLTVADIETMVMPLILLKQFRVFYREGTPVAALLYVRAAEATTSRSAHETTDRELRGARSNDNVHVVLKIAPFSKDNKSEVPVV